MLSPHEISAKVREYLWRTISNPFVRFDFGGEAALSGCGLASMLAAVLTNGDPGQRLECQESNDVDRQQSLTKVHGRTGIQRCQELDAGEIRVRRILDAKPQASPYGS